MMKKIIVITLLVLFLMVPIVNAKEAKVTMEDLTKERDQVVATIMKNAGTLEFVENLIDNLYKTKIQLESQQEINTKKFNDVNKQIESFNKKDKDKNKKR